MDIRSIILKKLSKKRQVKSSEIVKETGFSRAYINRFFKELENEGLIVRLGKARKTFYVKADKKSVAMAKLEILAVHYTLENKNLSEDLVLERIKKESGIFSDLPENISRILDYAFTEMLNNAIEHSRSKKIEIFFRRRENRISFDVIDKGIGIFNNIMQKHKLKSHLEAVQDLLKGKQTTAPKEHSGEGIFFTSKAADILIVQSSSKRLLFNNLLEDIFIEDVKQTTGTKVSFSISVKSKRSLKKIFDAYTDKSFEFSKTKAVVKLYKMGTDYISRSQARRILSGLDKFKTIVLDFREVKTIGQAFADEVFRVWKRNHPNIKIIERNANENIVFMIKRSGRI